MYSAGQRAAGDHPAGDVPGHRTPPHAPAPAAPPHAPGSALCGHCHSPTRERTYTQLTAPTRPGTVFARCRCGRWCRSRRMHHLPRLCGSNKSLPSSLNPSHPKTTSRAFVPRRRTTSAVAPMTYAQHTRPYERIPERQSSWGGGLPAGVNPPTASPSINTCLMHTDRSDGMPTTKEALTSACCSQDRIICCCLRSEFSGCPRSN